MLRSAGWPAPFGARAPDPAPATAPPPGVPVAGTAPPVADEPVWSLCDSGEEFEDEFEEFFD